MDLPILGVCTDTATLQPACSLHSKIIDLLGLELFTDVRADIGKNTGDSDPAALGAEVFE